MIEPSFVCPTMMAAAVAVGADVGGVVVGVAPYPELLPPVAAGWELELPQPAAISPAAANANGIVTTHRRGRLNFPDSSSLTRIVISSWCDPPWT
jgi:hypothetical protein